MERGDDMSTQSELDARAADCRKRGVGMSACAESFRASDVGCDGTIAILPDPNGFRFECHGVPDARKASVLLAEAQQRIAAANNARASSTPLLVVGGLVLAGVIAYAVTRT